MESSKFLITAPIHRKGYLAEEINHSACDCLLCKNDVKPISKPKLPREVSIREYSLPQAQAYHFILQKITSPHFISKLSIPDTFFIQDSALIYYSRNHKKIKIKVQQTNLDIKKHFEEKKKKRNAYLQSTFTANFGLSLTSLPHSISENSSMNLKNGELKNGKEVAIATYSDGSQQLVTEVLLGKILQKRKNDPFWQDVSSIALIPPEVKHPIELFTYLYERNQAELIHLEQVMSQMAQQIDSYDEQQENMNAADISLSSFKQDQQHQYENQQESKILQTTSSIVRRGNSFSKSKKKHISHEFPMSMSQEETQKHIKSTMKSLSIEIISFLQVTEKVRVLTAKFVFFADEKLLHFCQITDFIGVNLLASEMRMVHDRYKEMDEMKVQQIVDMKMQLDSIEFAEFWKVIAAVVNDCLEHRKIQLKLTKYNKPDSQTLIQIFHKILPQFSVDKIFSNQNWKNQLKSVIQEIKKKVSAVIQEDQGIRILKRFGIEFFRTFK